MSIRGNISTPSKKHDQGRERVRGAGGRSGRGLMGGRSAVRSVLFMSALVATQRNQTIAAFYQRLLEQVKAKKLALVACMRKWLVMLNAMLKHNQLCHPPSEQST